MTITLQTTGVHHLVLRSSDLTRARNFYGGTLGLPIVLETWDSFVALAGKTVLVVRSLETRAPAGLDHVALACGDEAELQRVAGALEAAEVPSTGLRFDPVLRRRYVGFTDPDGIPWEFYMAFSHTEIVCDARY